MARNSNKPIKPAFHAPMRLDWTDEKLATLSQEQLLTLLDNLDQQGLIGRVNERDARLLDQRITALLTRANGTKRRKKLAAAAEQAVADSD